MPVLTDLRLTMRQWRRRPWPHAMAILFLAVGIGAVAAVFAVVDATLLRPLPLPAPERLVWIESVDRGVPGASSPGLVGWWRDRNRSLSSVGAVRLVRGTVRDRQGLDRLEGAQVSAAALESLGLRPHVGRLFTADDDQSGAPPVLVVTHRLWRTRYDADPAWLGQLIEIDGQGRTLVGVLPPAADRLPFGGDWFTPLPLPADASAATGPRYLSVLGRLAPGASADDARSELSAIAASAGAVGDAGTPLAARVQGLATAFGGEARRVLVPLLAAALLVLLVAAANTASLLLAEQQGRRSEFAVRAALGAGRRRLFTQWLTETLVATAAAGALGLVLALWGTAGLVTILPPDVTGLASAAIDLRTAAVVVVLVGLLTLAIGLIPASRHARGRFDLAGEGRTVVGGPDRLRMAFVTAQIALAVSLTTGGALMIETTRALAAAPSGYDGTGVWTAALRFQPSDYPTATALTTAFDRIIGAVGARPGVASVAVASRVPLAGGAPGSDVALSGDPFTPGVDRQTRIRLISPGYFRTAGVRLVAGRDVTGADTNGAAPVVLVNETLAARLTPGRSPVGALLHFAVPDFNGRTPTDWQIVGVVADTRDQGPRDAAPPEVFVAVAQAPPGVFEWIGRQVLLVARTAPDAGLTPATLRTAVQSAEPRMPAFDIQTLEQRFAAHIATERLLTVLLVTLGTTGLALSVFGVGALVLQMVASRSREMALRLTLGASPAAVVREASRRGWQLAMVGCACGLFGALGVGRLLAAVTFGTGAVDGPVLLMSVALVGAATALGVWVPARRAARVDPAVVLRAE